MIRLNLATKPGLQRPEKKGAENVAELITPQTTAPAQPAPPGEAISSTQEMPKIDDELFAAVEKNLEMLEQAEEEEFIPRHISVAQTPEEKAEEEKKEQQIETLLKRPTRRKIFTALRYIIILAVLGGGGYFGYWKFFNVPAPKIVIPSEMEEPVPTSPPSDSIPTGLVPEQSFVSSESAPPVAEQPQAVPQVISQPTTSQIDDNYARQIMMSENALLQVVQVLTNLPRGIRLQYLKCKDQKISFIIYVNTNDEAVRLKSALTAVPGQLSPEIFYIEQVATQTPNIQVMAIFKIRPPDVTQVKRYQYLNDVQLTQTLWSTGRRSQINQKPLLISDPDVLKIRRGELSGNGTLTACTNLLRSYAQNSINYGIDQVMFQAPANLPPGELALNFTFSGIIYPQKI